MPSDPPKKPPQARRDDAPTSPLGMIDSLIGPGDQPGTRTKGRMVLLAHARAQRENRLSAEKRAAANRMNETREPDDAPAPKAATPRDDRPAPGDARAKSAANEGVRPRPDRSAERPDLDAMIVKALGPSARSHVRDGALDRESALTDLIARTQERLNSGGEPAAEAADQAGEPEQPQPRGEREAMIAAAMRTHRDRQAVFDELSLRQRATLRATAEALVTKGAGGK